jgi:hypothetical protein
MKRAIKIWALVAVAAVAYSAVPETHASVALGSIRGFVKDASGNPLGGVDVVVLSDAEEAKSDKVIKRASTDKDGKFTAAGILPGRYRIKAEADGFKPVEFPADVRPNKATVFDSISLRRVSTLADEASLNGNSKYAARKANRTIFHLEEAGGKPAEAAGEETTVALTDRTPEMHGVINAFGQSSAGTDGSPGSFMGANFAVSQQIGREANMVVSGQVGYGEGAPQRLEVLTAAPAGDRHRLSVALGYARFTFSRKGAIPKLGQFSISATDTWQVSGPVLVVYGMEFARFAEGASATSVLPRLGIAVDAAAHTRLSAGLVPGSSGDYQSKVNLESGEIVFSEPRAVAITDEGTPVMDRSYRLQFGAEQVLSDKSSIEMMAFFDTISGHGVGLLAIPLDGGGSGPVLRGEQQNGSARGMRVVYRRRVNSVIDGAVGYAFGQGQRLDERGITEPAQLFSNELFHVFSAQVAANFVSTGTKVSTVLRLAPEQAVFAIDPFQGQIATYDPNLSLSLSQEIPDFGFLPGQWEAMVDLRNLLDQQASISDERSELVASRFRRLVRVGLSLRF